MHISGISGTHPPAVASTPLSPSPDAAPFVIEHLRLDLRANGNFTPSARAVLTPHLRTSGLLRSLPDNGAKTLLMLLTFLTSNGHVHPSLTEIASAFGEDERSARARMQRLITFVWQGQPIVREVQRELGSDSYCLAPHVAAVRDALPDTATLLERNEAASKPFASREAIYAHTRRTYAVPRTVAERHIADQLGHAPEEAEATPKGEAYRGLVALGIPRETCDALIRTNPAERILQQLAWLPHRNARTPSKFIVAAIEHDYDPPLSVIYASQVQEHDQTQGEDLPEASNKGDITGDIEIPSASEPPVMPAAEEQE